MERKEFLLKSGVLTTGLLLHNQMMAAFASKANGREIKIAIIGCGDRAMGLAEVLTTMPENYTIVAACDILPLKVEAAKKKFNNDKMLFTTNYKDVLNNKNVDAVLIATPPFIHFQIAKDAILSGKHVYLEKVMTFNVKEALALQAICSSQPNQILQVGHQYRYTPVYFKVKEMITTGYLGKIVSVEARWDRNGSWRRPVPQGYTERQVNWRMYREYSGGLPAELLSHQIDFVNWAFETHPDEVYATGGVDFYKDGRETFDNVQATLRYNQAEQIGNFGSTCSNAHDGFIFKLRGAKGSVKLLMKEGLYYPEAKVKKELETVDGVAGATEIAWNKDGGTPILSEPVKDGSWYALQEFYKSVKEKTLPASNVYTGASAAIAVYLINQSLFNKKIEYWTPKYNFKK